MPKEESKARVEKEEKEEKVAVVARVLDGAGQVAATAHGISPPLTRGGMAILVATGRVVQLKHLLKQL